MKFFVFDDLRDVASRAKKNPDAQYVGNWCDAWAVDEHIGDCEKCPVCDALVSMLKWLEPYRIRLTNTKYPDRLTSWLPESLVISGKVKTAYEHEGLSGIMKFTPVDEYSFT